MASTGLKCSIACSGLISFGGLNWIDLFWFKKPKFLLWLIHFVLFQNAFELASFFWFWGFDLRILTKEEDCRGRPVLGRAVGGAQPRKGDMLGRWPSWAVVSRCGRWQKPQLCLREGPAGAAASAERQGAMTELLEAGDGRRGRSRPASALLLQASPPLLLEAPPPLLMEKTWPAGGGHRLAVDGRRACRPSSGAGHGRISSA